jgi:hypothetical protein
MAGITQNKAARDEDNRITGLSKRFVRTPDGLEYSYFKNHGKCYESDKTKYPQEFVDYDIKNFSSELIEQWKGIHIEERQRKAERNAESRIKPQMIFRDNRKGYNVTGCNHAPVRQRMRVPSKKRSRRQWQNFLDMFPNYNGQVPYDDMKSRTRIEKLDLYNQNK